MKKELLNKFNNNEFKNRDILVIIQRDMYSDLYITLYKFKPMDVYENACFINIESGVRLDFNKLEDFTFKIIRPQKDNEIRQSMEELLKEI